MAQTQSNQPRQVDDKYTPDPPAGANYNDTVVVGCNLPNGLILRLFKWVEEPVAGSGGVHTEKVARPVGGAITLNGNAANLGAMSRGQIPEYGIVGGYALTQVPRDFWEAWLEQNKDADYVKNKCVWSESTEPRARSKARAEYRDIKSGLEPIDPDNPSAKSGELGRIQRATGNE